MINKRLHIKFNISKARVLFVAFGLLLLCDLSISAQQYAYIPAANVTRSNSEEINQARADLQSLLYHRDKYDLEFQMKEIKRIKNLELTDDVVINLIETLEDLIEKERIILPEEKAEADNFVFIKNFNKEFSLVIDKIARAEDYDKANKLISEALSYFSSDNVTVLVDFASAGEDPVYERPQTIYEFLEYCKFVKQTNFTVSNIKLEENNKIDRLILRKIYE
ncbi:hypothetical protein OO013_08925 [Mangrovivirga sp. M17]|uniref:Gliding motility-associated protein GldM N-terminal domain-containing protein n=1 Tax=Mangrovivirga halotolerans TaxID=2993936 RepID=A0ABT3RQT3_9BACT|nr:hypothetical protein [Mangrovivirga halotolerans]MCX2743985.1 hypothetical protein [Mangrovivirga halotolerans]